jgi:hypothetical protein
MPESDAFSSGIRAREISAPMTGSAKYGAAQSTREDYRISRSLPPGVDFARPVGSIRSTMRDKYTGGLI